MGSVAPHHSIKNDLLNWFGRHCIFPQMFPLTLEGRNVSQVPLKNGSGEPGARCSGIQRPQAQIYTQHRREGSAHKVCTEVRAERLIQHGHLGDINPMCYVMCLESRDASSHHSKDEMR